MPPDLRTAPSFHRTSGTLSATQPFDFRRSLEFVDQFSPAKGEQLVADGSLTKALGVEGQTVAFRVTGPGAGRTGAVRYTVLSDQPISSSLKRTTGARISWYLSLKDDLEPFYRLGRADPTFRPRMQQLHGLHQVKFLTPFENACWAVLAQRIPMPVARSLKQRLVDDLGGQIRVDGIAHSAFPEPADLLAAGSRLDSIIRNQRKARYVLAVAEAFDRVDETFLHHGDFQEVQAWLRSIDGIGEWSAAFVLFRGLGRIDRMPLTPPFVKSVRALYGAGLTEAEVSRISKGYGPWAGYWAMYLRVGAGEIE
jgi:DNA-3-methyladenine glycosylase II